MKILVNTLTGQQEVIEVGEGGGYFDETRVLWDERIDGSLPEITLGGMVRSGTTLTFDAALFATVTVNPTEYQRQRSLEYPAIADYLDGIVKSDTAQVQAYIDACLAVKAKYPKPE
tara:strand:- start:124 stop:471 length:348 start_codon:yes stop_codon:yes gene_type:complete